VNFYPFHIGDFASHTRHLSLMEDLAYRRLIDQYYLDESPIKGEPSLIARRIGMSDFSSDVQYILENFFEKNDDLWISKRCDDEIAKYRLKADSARYANTKKTEKILALKSELKSEPSQLPTKNQEPRTKNHIKTITPVGFDLFWNAYDKKIGKPNAIKQWLKIKPSDDLVQTIVSKALADAAAKPDAKFRKDPERWLKGKHWEDEVIVAMPLERTELPLGSDQQIETAYRLECGGDPRQSRFNSYHEMRKFVIDHREKQRVRA